MRAELMARIREAIIDKGCKQAEAAGRCSEYRSKRSVAPSQYPV